MNMEIYTELSLDGVDIMFGLRRAWHEAENLAEDMGGHLAWVEDEDALDWFVKKFRPQDHQEVRHWVGGCCGRA